MRVLQVTTHLNIGGIGHYIVSLTKTLRSRGIDCVVASGGGDFEWELRSNGIKHVHLDLKTKAEFSPKVFKAVFSLAGMAKKEGVDIIHAHTRVSQVAAFFASALKSMNSGIAIVTQALPRAHRARAKWWRPSNVQP